MSSSVNIVCMKWGTRYPAPYVNILFRSLERYLHRPFRFLCITDDTADLLPEVETIGFPPNPGIKQSKWPNVFMKLLITQDGFANLSGPTMFLDLDLVILDSVDCFFDYEPGKNCIIHNWIEARKQIFRGRPDVGNSSIFRFEAGKSDYIYQTFIREIEDADDHSKYPTEQAFLTYAMKEKCWWPDEWVVSFKRHCRPMFPLNLIQPPRKPKGAKFLVFHGHPDPVDAPLGYKGKKIHHRVLPAPWVTDYWKL